MLWNHIFCVKQKGLENSSRVDNYSSKWTSRNRVKQGHPPRGQRSFSFSLPLLRSLSSHVLGTPCPSSYSAVLVLPLCCVSKSLSSPFALCLSKQTFYTSAASAIISSSQCLYHLFGIYHTLPIILTYLFTGIFCHPYQEDCKHNHTKAYIHTDIIYTDVSWWQSLKHLTNANI